jgi:hypothetical protein
MLYFFFLDSQRLVQDLKSETIKRQIIFIEKNTNVTVIKFVQPVWENGKENHSGLLSMPESLSSWCI